MSSLSSESLFGVAGVTGFTGIGTYSLSSSSRASGILLCTLNPLTIPGFFPPEFYLPITKESQQSNCWRLEKQLTTCSLDNAACANGSERERNSFKYPLPLPPTGLGPQPFLL